VKNEALRVKKEEVGGKRGEEGGLKI